MIAVDASSFAQHILSGSMVVALPIAVLAGVVSFASPCIIPLVPGYVAYAAGVAGREADAQRRGRVLAATALFIAGFSTVYVLMGLVVGYVGEVLIAYSGVLSRVMGVAVIAMGLMIAGAIPAMRLGRPLPYTPAAGLVGAPVLGAVLGLSWSPCIGPVLSAVLALGASAGSTPRAVVLVVAYCVGLGAPFLLVALGVRSGLRRVRLLADHRLLIARVGGAVLVVTGVLLVTGWWTTGVDALRLLVADVAPVL